MRKQKNQFAKQKKNVFELKFKLLNLNTKSSNSLLNLNEPKFTGLNNNFQNSKANFTNIQASDEKIIWVKWIKKRSCENKGTQTDLKPDKRNNTWLKVIRQKWCLAENASDPKFDFCWKILNLLPEILDSWISCLKSWIPEFPVRI